MLGLLLLWRGQFVGSFHLLQCTVLWLLKLSWGGIRLNPQLSSSALLFDFGSMNSLRGGCPQKFLFYFSLCALSPQMDKIHVYSQVFEQSMFLFLPDIVAAGVGGGRSFSPPPIVRPTISHFRFIAHAHCSCFDNSSSLPPPSSSRLESWEPPWPGACDTRDMNEQTHFQQFFYCTLNVLQVHNCGAIRLDP